MNTVAQSLDLAVRCHQAGNLQQAEQIYRQILQVEPGNINALHLLGLIAMHFGKLDHAIEHIRQSLRLKPNFAEAHSNLGLALQQQGKLAEAVESWRTALSFKPDYPEALNSLAIALKEQGLQEEAIANWRRALQLRPDYADALSNLGVALQEQGSLDEALASWRAALRANPNYADAYNNLGGALKERGSLDEAVTNLHEALRLRPDFAEAYNNLAAALKDMGLLDEALAAFRRASELRPQLASWQSNVIYTLHFHPDCNAAALNEEHRSWNQRHAEPLAKFAKPHLNVADPDRRLRVGYVSPDLRNHPVGRFLLPLLEAHDERCVDVFCYASVAVFDEVSQQLRSHSHHWIDANDLSDESLAQRIQEDRIDILVDLSAHTKKSRLLVFARKPAPVQVTYLAYCSTAGLRAIDYRLTDPFFDPPGQQPAFNYSETSIWLPETYWCYQPPYVLPPASPLPALDRGHVTFGCLNNFCKATQPVLDTWRHLIQSIAGSRLIIHAHAGSHRDRVQAFMREGGVDPSRVEFMGFVLPPEYFRLYDGIDIALDPFPYAGGTTTCDALWMGVPVVSLAGSTAVGRAGVSILSNAGLTELIATTPQDYVRIAVELASDLRRLAALRAGLRAQLERTPLTDAPRFARNVESAFREMWRRWCQSPRSRNATLS
jgi:predicted O-linked N-acetylglucosamine transferase (SPINDLY family)